MKAKWGMIVVDGRGKIGGHVASKNRAGSYFRTKVTPVNPSSTYQQAVRNRLSGLSSGWRGLTTAQRSSWNSAVSDYSKTDIFGDIRNPSGFNLYQRLNNNLLNCSEAALTTPPPAAAVDAFTSLSVAVAAGAQTVTITYAAAIAANHKVLVRATPAMSAGVSFAKSEFRQIDVMATADASPFAISAEYITKFGEVGAAGQKVFIEMVQVNTDTGQAGIPFQASAIIGA